MKKIIVFLTLILLAGEVNSQSDKEGCKEVLNLRKYYQSTILNLIKKVVKSIHSYHREYKDIILENASIMIFQYILYKLKQVKKL